MSFDYDPRDANSVIPAGDYEATIKEYVDTKQDGSPLVSQKGEKMCYVVFTIYTQERERTLRCYFTAKGGLWRYRELAHAIGKAEDFSAGKFSAADYIGSGLRVSLAEKDDPQYGPQNNIEAFAPLERATATSVPGGKAATITEADIPFD